MTDPTSSAPLLDVTPALSSEGSTQAELRPLRGAGLYLARPSSLRLPPRRQGLVPVIPIVRVLPRADPVDEPAPPRGPLLGDDDHFQLGEVLGDTPGTPSGFLRSWLLTREEAFDSLILGALRSGRSNSPATVTLRTPRAKRIFVQLKRYTMMAVGFTGLGLLVASLLFLRAGVAFVSSRDLSACGGPLRDWWITGLMGLHVVVAAGVPFSALVQRSCSQRASSSWLRSLWPASFLLVSTSFLMLVLWCIGALSYAKSPPDCPPLKGITYEVLALQVVVLVVLCIAQIYLCAAQPLLTRLSAILGRGIASDIAQFVQEVPLEDAPERDDCVICLGCEEDEDEQVRIFHAENVPEEAGEARFEDDATKMCEHFMDIEGGDKDSRSMVSSSASSVSDLEPGHKAADLLLQNETMKRQAPHVRSRPRPKWRRLHCGHQFHEACLFAWLQKSRRCPMCRCDVRKPKTAPPRVLAALAAVVMEVELGQGHDPNELGVGDDGRGADELEAVATTTLE